jgi:hypothetical protein
MASKVTTLVCAAGKILVGWLKIQRSVLIPRCPSAPGRRKFNAKYKLEVLAAYAQHPRASKARCFAVRACIPATSPSGEKPATPVHWRG